MARNNPDGIPSAVPAKVIMVSEAECWVLDGLIHHDYRTEAPSIERGLLIKVMGLLREFADADKAPPELPLALTETECWAIDAHVQFDLSFNGRQIGRQLLLKVFDLILQFDNERRSERLTAGLPLDPAHDLTYRQYREKLEE